jgi:hypothetical protein
MPTATEQIVFLQFTLFLTSYAVKSYATSASVYILHAFNFYI